MITRAEQLGIVRGPLWIIGHSDEENALLDPIPDDVEVITERGRSDLDEEDDAEAHQPVSAAIVVVDDAETLSDDLDDALPQLGSVPVVWVALPSLARGLTTSSVAAALDDYGWSSSAPVDLGHGWKALRVTPA